MLVDKEELVGGVVVLDSNFKLWELGIMDGSGCQPIKKYPASTVEQGTALEQLAKFIADMNAFDLVKTKDLCLVDMEDQNNFMVLKYASALVRAYDLNRGAYGFGPVHVVCTQEESSYLPELCNTHLAGEVYFLYDADGNYKGYEVSKIYYHTIKDQYGEEIESNPEYHPRFQYITDLIRGLKNQCQGICSS